MPSLLFPDAGSRRAEDQNGNAPASRAYTVYADETGLTLAEIYEDINGTQGALIAGSVVLTDAYGYLPLWWGPTGGESRLWVTDGVAPLWPVDAVHRDRIDSLVRAAYTVNATAGDYATLAAALGGIGSAQADLLITSAVTLGANATVPANVTLRFARTGSLTLAGFALTVNGRMAADRTATFSGSGAVTFGPGAADTVYPEWWGAKSDGSADAGPAITSAVNAVKTNGGVVSLAAGTYLVSTTINASNITPNSSFHLSPRSVTLQGQGSRRTLLTGGESSFGFVEMVGSNYINIDGITFQGSGTLAYGILIGRTTGDATSGVHSLHDVFIYGTFSLAGVFALSSEVCVYDRVHVYALSGRAMVLAKDVSGWTATAKYTALTTTVPMGGGNGVIRMLGCQLYSASATATDALLTVEFAQTFYASNLYCYSQNLDRQVVVSKRCHDITIEGLHQEFLNVEPWGVYFSAANEASPDFTNVSLVGCRMYGVFAEDAVRISNLFMRVNFRGTKTWTVDVDKLYGSAVHADGTLAANVPGISQANLKYRARTDSIGNDWGTALIANVSVPNAGLDRITSRDAAETYTNKRITPRLTATATPGATASPSFDSADIYAITALASDTTISVGGTPTNGQPMLIRIKDNGTPRNLSWAANYRAVGVTLPAVTVASKTLYVSCRYNSADAKIDVLSVSQEA